MNASGKIKKTGRSVLDIGPAIGKWGAAESEHTVRIRNLHYDEPPAEPRPILSNSKQDSAKAPRVKFVDKDGQQEITVDHPDEVVGSELLMKALGSTDLDFLRGVLRQLADPGLGRVVTEEQVNFILSVVKGIKPTCQLESLLGILIAYTQSAAVMIGTDLLAWENFAQRESSERSFNSLAKTVGRLTDTLMRLRAGGAQVVTTHVSVNDNAQAIVGNVTQTARENVLDNTAVASPLALTENRTAPMPIMEEGKERAEVSVRYRPKKHDG